MLSVRQKLLVVACALFALAVIVWVAMPESRGWQLVRASLEGNSWRAKLLVWLGTDVNFATGSGTALHGAAARGDLNLMRFLIAHGARVDEPVKFGATPLWEARLYHQKDAERLLLARGANPDTSHIHVP